jgi:archaellum biogenesis ATPase FlaH
MLAGKEKTVFETVSMDENIIQHSKEFDQKKKEIAQLVKKHILISEPNEALSLIHLLSSDAKEQLGIFGEDIKKVKDEGTFLAVNLKYVQDGFSSTSVSSEELNLSSEGVIKYFNALCKREKTILEDFDVIDDPDAKEQVIDAKDLMNLKLPEPIWIAKGIIPEGLAMLVGKPKIGKSYFALELAIDVAKGETFMENVINGGFEASKGNVLYFSLEDNLRRLQARIKQITDNFEGLENLKLHDQNYVHEIGTVISEIERWRVSVDNPKLVVIDTLIRVLPAKTKYEDEYQRITRILSPLQKLALEGHFTILTLHHAKKQISEDTTDMALGSTALTASTDTNMYLLADEAGIKFHVDGKEVERQAYILNIDPSDRPVVKFLGTPDTAKLSEARQAILEILDEPKTQSEIVAETGKKQSYISRTLKDMQKEHIIIKEGNKYKKL